MTMTDRNATLADTTPMQGPWLALLSTVRDDVTERIEWLTNEDGLTFDDLDGPDVAHEAADGCVPIYTHELAALCADRPSLLTDVPEIGPAAEHYGPGLRWVVANIYEALSTEALDTIYELEGATGGDR